MINLEKDVKRGRQATPARCTIYGVPGVGKTTFAAEAPNAIIIPVERGSQQLDVARTPQPHSWPELLGMVDAFIEQKHDYKTLVVDTLDAAEQLLTESICASVDASSITDGKLAYGVGPNRLGMEFRPLLSKLERLEERRGMNIVLVSHCHAKKFNDPVVGEYDRYVPKLADRVWGAVNEWSHDVLFANFVTVRTETKSGKGRATITDKRTMYTERGTGFEAKNRHSLPKVMPLSWSAYQTAIDGFFRDAKTVRESILALAMADHKLAEKAASFVAAVGNDVPKLIEIEQRLLLALAEKTAEKEES